jgi:hypothetical protein
MKNGQKGITFLSFIIVLAVIGFFGFLAMRLIPVYISYMGAVKSITALANDPRSSSFTIEEIRKDLDPKFNISYVEGVDLKRDVKLVKAPNGQKSIQLKYEARRPLIYNLDYVAMFDKSIPLGGKAPVE